MIQRSVQKSMQKNAQKSKKINETKCCPLENFNKSDKPLTRWVREKKKSSQDMKTTNQHAS